MRVVWTRGAGSRLRAAYRYLANENRQAAWAFLNAVETLEANLAHFPEIGFESGYGGVRSLPIPRFRYRVFYRVDEDAVRIIRIRHTSRRPLR
jgi:addiction module RelE/StbE family toxin